MIETKSPFRLLILLLGAVLLGACAGGTGGDAESPSTGEISGPALVMFYTDG